MKTYVNYEDVRWKEYDVDFDKIAAAAAAAGGAAPGAVVSITLIDDKAIHKLNKKYRGIDKPTNVLSFELGDKHLLGDIFISLDTVRKEAAAEKISVSDHTAHMVVHGVLHLLGYDHLNDKDAEEMEKLETKILAEFGIKNPYTAQPRAHTAVWRAVALAFCGLISAFGFAPFYIWPATLVGFCAAYWILFHNPTTRMRTYFRAMPFGAIYTCAMFWWMLNSIFVVPELARQFAIWTVPAMLGLGIAGALVFSVPFAFSAACTSAARPFVFAALWTTILWGREWILTGFPWNPVANISLPWAALANSMSVWGALGLTFAIVGFIAAIAECIIARFRKLTVIPLIVFGVTLIGGALLGARNMHMDASAINAPTVRVVQPAQSQSDKMPHNRADAIRIAENNVRRMVLLGAGDGPVDLVVYPETTYPFAITDNDDMPVARALGGNVIVGATHVKNGVAYNSMIAADADGRITDIYNKSHLVPFGEYGPLGGLMPAPVNLGRGAGPRALSLNLPTGKFVVAPAICYEIIFSDSLITRDMRDVSAIINITNDTWFGRTPGTYQHLDMVRRYAIESGMPIIRANYSGISAFVTPAGVVTAHLPIGATGFLDASPNAPHKTIYRAIGRNWWMIIILGWACVWAIALNALNKKH